MMNDSTSQFSLEAIPAVLVVSMCMAPDRINIMRIHTYRASIVPSGYQKAITGQKSCCNKQRVANSGVLKLVYDAIRDESMKRPPRAHLTAPYDIEKMTQSCNNRPALSATKGTRTKRTKE